MNDPICHVWGDPTNYDPDDTLRPHKVVLAYPPTPAERSGLLPLGLRFCSAQPVKLMSANLHVLRMNETLRNVLAGAGSLLLAPAGAIPPPQLRITLPPRNATEGIARDFSVIGGHFKRAIAKVEHSEQMELELHP